MASGTAILRQEYFLNYTVINTVCWVYLQCSKWSNIRRCFFI